MSPESTPKGAAGLRARDTKAAALAEDHKAKGGALAGWLDDRTSAAKPTSYVLKKIFPDPPDKERSTRMTMVREKVVELTENGIGAEMAKGTLWGAYNAVTELIDHYRRTTADDMAGLKSMWFGSGERIKKGAFTAAMEMVN